MGKASRGGTQAAHATSRPRNATSHRKKAANHALFFGKDQWLFFVVAGAEAALLSPRDLRYSRKGEATRRSRSHATHKTGNVTKYTGSQIAHRTLSCVRKAYHPTTTAKVARSAGSWGPETDWRDHSLKVSSRRCAVDQPPRHHEADINSATTAQPFHQVVVCDPSLGSSLCHELSLRPVVLTLRLSCGHSGSFPSEPLASACC